MVEQWTHKPLVGGSNPPFATGPIKGPGFGGLIFFIKRIGLCPVKRSERF